MRTGREYAEVVGVFIDDKAVDRCQPAEIFLSRGVQLYLRADVNFIALPTLDRNGTVGRSRNRDCAAVEKAPTFMPRDGARQERPNRRSRLLVLLRCDWQGEDESRDKGQDRS